MSKVAKNSKNYVYKDADGKYVIVFEGVATKTQIINESEANQKLGSMQVLNG